MPFNEETFKDWIVQAESHYNKAKTEYEEARDYYENEQSPSDVPTDKEYVENNIITDTIDRSVGQIASGEIQPTIVGGGPLAKPAKLLHDDILEANEFNENLLPENLNYFYCEGLGGWKFIANPAKIGKYGIGFPEIYTAQPGEIWFDPNSRIGMHTDDIFRIHPKRIRLDYARDKWGRSENGRKNKLWRDITESSDDYDSGEDTTEPSFCSLYEIEYKETKFMKVEGEKGQFRKEYDVYYMVKIINKTVVVEGPTPTEYPFFRMIPMIHTPRKNVKYGRYPFGIFRKLKQKQDHLNVTASVILDAVKSLVKQLIVTKAFKPDEEAEMKIQASKTDGYINVKSTQADLEIHRNTVGIPPDLLQLYGLLHRDMDEIKGSSSQSQQFQSAASGQLSGKAIGNLQFAGILPEYTKKMNIEFSLKQLSRCIMHYIKTEMGQPFSIERTVDGKDQAIDFNKSVSDSFQGNELQTVQPTEDGLKTNFLSELGETDIKFHIEMNMMQQREVDMNKALILAQAQKIADKDLMKKLYPNEWRELYDNLVAQGGAMALVEQISSYGPEFAAMATDIIAKAAQQFGITQEGQKQ